RRARHGGAGGRRRRSGDCSGFRTWPSRSQMPTGPVRDTRGLAGPSEGRLAVLQRKRREGRGRCALLSTYGRGAAAAVDVSGLAGSPLTPTLSRKGRGGKRHRPLSPRGSLAGEGGAHRASDGRVRGPAQTGLAEKEEARMKAEKAVNIADLRRMAKRRLPRLCFDFIEGGLEDERGLERNERAFDRHQIVPRYLVDVSRIDQRVALLGRDYALPFGIAPTGLAGLFRRGGDLMLAEAAKAADIPFIMSGASTGSIEAAARIAPDNAWYQLYGARDMKISEDQVRRARDAGMSTLVHTVDVPVNSKRERNIRNGFVRPYKITPSMVIDGLLHPAWLIEYLRHGGMPSFDNWEAYAPPGAGAEQVSDLVGTQTPSTQTWRELEAYRRL